jgi:3-oxoacyl-[acyl-carrier protein] reductase
MKLGLEGKNVFVAGASGGIGSAIAETFLEEGASVILHGRDATRLEARRAPLEARFPGRVSAVAADLTTPAGRDAARAAAGEALDAAVLCVGDGNVAKGHDLDQGRWDGIFAQNFYADVHLANALVPALKKGRAPSVCFIGSIAGLQVMKAPAGYAVAKAALDAYAKRLAHELAPEIRVNIVHPGNVLFEGGRWEELKSADPSGVQAHVESEVAQKRFGTPEEIAAAVVFVSSPKASFMNGASVVVDGGQLKSL